MRLTKKNNREYRLGIPLEAGDHPAVVFEVRRTVCLDGERLHLCLGIDAAAGPAAATLHVSAEDAHGIDQMLRALQPEAHAAWQVSGECEVRIESLLGARCVTRIGSHNSVRQILPSPRTSPETG